MRALVTGAGGFVGANLVRHLLRGGHDPIAAIRPGGDPWRLEGLRGEAAVAEVDLDDPDAVERLVDAERPDAIFHLAAHGAYSWQRDLDRMLAVNVRSTEALLAAAARTGATVVHAGSSSEYGYKDHAPREQEHVEPNSHYAVTKVAATHLCRLAAATHGVRTATLRLYSIYGPWEDPGRLLPTLVRRCRAGGWPPLVGPDAAHDFVWVDDACEAFVRTSAADLPPDGAVLNVASGMQTTLAELVGAARKLFGVTAEPEWGTMAHRSWDSSVWVGDPRAAQELIGWEATTTIEQGLGRLGQWFEHHPELAERYG